MSRRRICVVTGTRAEYGLLKWVIQGIKDDPALKLQIVATGAHLSPEFGLTYREIEADGFTIDRKIEMLMSSDTPVGIAKSMGLAMIGFADALAELKPDIMVVLGDRYEILAAAAAATVARIPIAHIHGGEATEGAIDEAFRHAITKMAHIHFVAAEPFRRRVEQLGEEPHRIELVGGLGIDAIRRARLLGRAELEQALGYPLLRRNLLVAFHPVTLEHATAAAQLQEVLAALSGLEETRLIFTMPNADTDGRALIPMIEDFVARHTGARAHTSLGHQRFFSCMALSDGIVGNSSSGLLEAPTFRIGTINIGDRQRGRPRAASVIDCVPERGAIAAALDRVLSPEFKRELANVANPYGEGGASDKIVAGLKSVSLNGILKKRFHDLTQAEAIVSSAEGGAGFQ